MLFNLLVASITTLLCFYFLFLIAFKKKFTNPDLIEKAKTQLPHIIPACVLIRVANHAVEMTLAITDNKVNDLLKYSKEAIYLLRFLIISSLSLISANK